MAAPQYALTLTCPDRPGIVATVSACVLRHGGNVLEAQQYGDVETGRFFMRVLFVLVDGGNCEALQSDFAALAPAWSMDWTLRDRSRPRRVMLLVSRFDHCLADLLYRWRLGELPMQLTAIVANHPREQYRHLDLDGVDFHHLPVNPQSRATQEAELWSLIERSGTELVVLARYMQILSAPLADKLAGRCINIHHSFLPGFKGARPYHQAHAQGVKLIGATAHFVTADLDDGAIIEQDTERVGHHHSPDDLVRIGRDIERRVLAQALRYVLDDRVLLNGRKTVVFSA
ncbi:formyltetrahydrofolate deformylase [Lysobacter sp. F6437]|uniref:formyltetrahydrofolate deformylase n=1 Tax=Lysobacter sp. F6437 TaxID=3459296 RepID=UPI00403DE79D